MKVYLFNTDSGLYEGEAFFDAREINEGVGATVKAPPERPFGQVPIYDQERGDWQLVPAANLKWREPGNE